MSNSENKDRLPVVVICALISPYRSTRDRARQIVGPGRFIEVFVDTPLDVCIARDPKGLYARARSGAIKHFTGVTSPYEAPEQPEIVLDTSKMAVQECVDSVVRYLERTGRLKS